MNINAYWDVIHSSIYMEEKLERNILPIGSNFSINGEDTTGFLKIKKKISFRCRGSEYRT